MSAEFPHPEEQPHQPGEDPFSEDLSDLGALIAQYAPEGADSVSEEPMNPDDVAASLAAVNSTVTTVREATKAEEAITLATIPQESPYEAPGYLIEEDEHGPMQPEHVRQLAGALLCREVLFSKKILSREQDAANRASGISPLKQVRSAMARAMKRAGFDADTAQAAGQGVSELVANVRDNVKVDPEVDPDQNAGRLIVELFRNPLTGEATLLAQTINGSPTTLEGRVKKAAAVGGLGLSVIREFSDNMGTYHIRPEDYAGETAAEQGCVASHIDPMAIESLPVGQHEGEIDPGATGLRAVWFTISTQKAAGASVARSASPAPVNA